MFRLSKGLTLSMKMVPLKSSGKPFCHKEGPTIESAGSHSKRHQKHPAESVPFTWLHSQSLLSGFVATLSPQSPPQWEPAWQSPGRQEGLAGLQSSFPNSCLHVEYTLYAESLWGSTWTALIWHRAVSLYKVWTLGTLVREIKVFQVCF